MANIRRIYVLKTRFWCYRSIFESVQRDHAGERTFWLARKRSTDQTCQRKGPRYRPKIRIQAEPDGTPGNNLWLAPIQFSRWRGLRKSEMCASRCRNPARTVEVLNYLTMNQWFGQSSGAVFPTPSLSFELLARLIAPSCNGAARKEHRWPGPPLLTTR
jgi:hypothetical protein